MTEVAIVLQAPFPGNAARLKRMNQFAEVLSDAGYRANLIVLDEDRDPLFRDQFEASYGSVSVRGCRKEGVAARLPIIKRTYAGKMAVNELRSLSAGAKLTAIVSYGQTVSFQRPIVQFSKEQGIRSVIDMTEWLNPTIYSIIGLSHLDHSLFNRWYYSRFDAMVGISPFWIKWFQKEVPAKPNFLIPAMASKVQDIPDNIFPSTEASKCLDLGYVGEFVARDRPEIFISALQLLRKDNIDFRFTVVSRAPEIAQNILRRAGLDDVSRVCSNLTTEAYRSVVGSMNVLFLLRDNRRTSVACSPTRIPEFLELGKIVVTTQNGGISSFLKDGESGIILSEDKLQANRICDEISSLSRSPELRRRLSHGAISAARDVFSQSRFVTVLDRAVKGS